VISAIFTKICRVFATFYCDFLLSLEVTGTFVPTYFRSRERKFHRWNSFAWTFAPWYFRSLEHLFHGTFVPWNFRSPYFFIIYLQCHYSGKNNCDVMCILYLCVCCYLCNKRYTERL